MNLFKDESESFEVIQTGEEGYVPCFVTNESGSKSVTAMKLKPVITAVVKNAEAGERVIKMFSGRAFSDEVAGDDGCVETVIVGVEPEHLKALEMLCDLVEKEGNSITQWMVEGVRELVHFDIDGHKVPYHAQPECTPD
ncbi:MAG: hypothetical protein KAJ29_06065 [Alphaproteobacteria bacterium]|nr:hypothetical protein [Alphaproteobacteria bacterium]